MALSDYDDIAIDLWTIAICRGSSPFALQGEARPVLSASDVDDVRAIFLADPFMIPADGGWHMFFEVLNRSNRLGEIGHAVSADGTSWTYDRIVLREPFHLSYPCVFEWNGHYWMVPETLGANAIRLYRGDPFPGRWTFVTDLVAGYAADPTVFRYSGRWWMFACLTPHQHRTLALYYADALTGPWHAHPRNPIVENDPSIGRPGGRVLVDGDRLFRFAQDSVPVYGRQVRAFEILELTADRYREREMDESPVLTASGAGWNAVGMHHLDAHRLGPASWIACVDGRRE